MFLLFALMAAGCFVAACGTLYSLCREYEPTEHERKDPFYTPVNLLFSQAHRGNSFSTRQRLAIGLFCLAALLAFLAKWFAR